MRGKIIEEAENSRTLLEAKNQVLTVLSYFKKYIFCVKYKIHHKLKCCGKKKEQKKKRKRDKH